MTRSPNMVDREPEATRATGTTHADTGEHPPQQIPQQLEHETVQVSANCCDEPSDPCEAEVDRNPLSMTMNRNSVRRDAKRCNNAHGRIRTSDLRFERPQSGSVTPEIINTSDDVPRTPSYNPGNAAQTGPDLEALADALAAVPEADRPAVVEHVKALASMSPAKRAAILTLTIDEDAEQ